MSAPVGHVMEGYFTALLLSGAALVTHGTTRRHRWARRTVRLLAATLAGIGLVAMAYGFALYEWLTVSWAVGLCGCCLAVSMRLGWHGWLERVPTVLVFTLSAIGFVLSVEGSVPNAPWVVSQAITHANYREGAHFVMLGNAVLNMTTVLIATQRLR